MATSTILIHESRRRWGPELKRQFFGQDVRVRVCGTLKDLEERLTSSPQAVCLLEFDAAPAECLQTLGRLTTRLATTRIAVVAGPDFRPLEWAVRELGSIAFLEEPISGDEMAAWCWRQFQIDQTES